MTYKNQMAYLSLFTSEIIPHFIWWIHKKSWLTKLKILPASYWTPKQLALLVLLVPVNQINKELGIGVTDLNDVSKELIEDVSMSKVSYVLWF